MSIISFEFYTLIAFTLLVYWVCPQKVRYVILLLTSCIFVWNANDKNYIPCFLMAVMIGIAYGAGVTMEKCNEKESMRRVIVTVAVILEAGMLVWLKDIVFFNLMILRFGGNFQIKTLLAPLGISYFALSLIGYILDVYWKTQTVEKNVLKLALFGSYFPMLTSGPIVRYRETGEELFKARKWSYQNFCFGIQRILWGFLKKIVIAERLGTIVNTIYGDTVTYAGLYIWVAMVVFALQLYMDFSGSMDIILGVSELFGIVLPENFELPFAARNLSEFWRKWHITLGAWLKDYILYPILKSRPWQALGKKTKKLFGKKTGKKIPVWCGLFFSWFLIGFWHGGGWNYILGVGLWFWFLIVLGEMLAPVSKKALSLLGVKTDCLSWHIFQSLRTFVLFMMGLSWFRAGSVTKGIEIYKSAVEVINPWIFFDESFLNMGLTKIDFGVLRLALLLVAVAGIIRLVTKKKVREWIAEQNTLFRWFVWLFLTAFIVIYGKYGPGYDAAEFIYRGF